MPVLVRVRVLVPVHEYEYEDAHQDVDVDAGDARLNAMPRVIRIVCRTREGTPLRIMLPASAKKTDALIRLARKGLVRARDLDAADIPRAYLKRLCDRGVLERVDRGLYRLTAAPVSELSSLAEVAKRVPHAIVCLVSALQVHGLTAEAPHAVWVLIDRNARMPALTYPALEVVRASGAARAHGVETRRIDGVEVRLTTAAKTVADCFR